VSKTGIKFENYLKKELCGD